MMTTTEPPKMNGKGSDQEIIDAVKERIGAERRKKFRSLPIYLTIGTLCFFMAILGEYTACSVFYLSLVIYEARNRP